jgi:hypothetical protein
VVCSGELGKKQANGRGEREMMKWKTLESVTRLVKTIEGVDEGCAAGALKETRHQVEHDVSETRGSRDQVVRRARAVVSVTRAMNARELVC